MTRAAGSGRRLGRILTTIASMVVLAVTGVSWVAWSAADRLENDLTVDQSLTQVLSGSSPQASAAPDSYPAVNVLIVGSDTRTGQGTKYGTTADSSGNGQSDTAFLLHISADRKSAFAVSIPRDSWVSRPGCRSDGSTDGSTVTGKFNAAFAVGGRACVIAAVKALTGVPVNHFVEVDFNGFKAIVDALGGVDMCTTKAISDPVRRTRTGWIGSGLELPKGPVHLNAEQALALVRARHIGGGSDLERIDRQHQFLSAVIREASSSGLLTNPVKLYGVLSSVAKSMTVDAGLSGDDLKTFLVSLQGMKPNQVRFYTVPNKPRGDGENVVWVTSKANRMWDAMIHDTAYPPTTTGTSSSGTPSSGSTATTGTGSDPSVASDKSCIS